MCVRGKARGRGSIPSDLKKSDRKLKSYKKKSYKIFIFASPSNIKSKKWQKIFDFFFRWHGQKFSITFWKPNFFTKCLVSEYEVPNFETIRINSWYFRQLYNAKPFNGPLFFTYFIINTDYQKDFTVSFKSFCAGNQG